MELAVGGFVGVETNEKNFQGMAFNSDETKMYLVGFVTKTIYQYTLSTPGDINSASYDGKSFSVLSEMTWPRSIMFNFDGTKVYVFNYSSLGTGGIYQYTLAIAWDISTASYDSIYSDALKNSKYHSAYYSKTYFKPDGTKIYVKHNTMWSQFIANYILSPAWDISTMQFGDELFIAGYGQNPSSFNTFCFGNSGKYVYFVSTLNRYSNPYQKIYRDTLGTAWDLGARNFSLRIGFSLKDVILSSLSIVVEIQLNAIGTKMYILTTDGKVYEFNLSTAWDIETITYNDVYNDVKEDNERWNFAEADGAVVVVGSGEALNGITIDCDVDVIRDRVEACLATSKGIRLVVTIDDEDVTNAVTGTPSIKHSFNKISSFSLTLKDAQFSPLVNPHITGDVGITVTAFVDRHKFRLFTGLVDTHKTRRTKDFQLSISGRGFGRKLLDKRMTLVSVQDSAEKRRKSWGYIALLDQWTPATYVSTVGAIIEFLAKQAGITDMDVPAGDEVTIEHSFQDQTIWDMIQKECELMGWFVRFDEWGKMLVGPKIIKTNETIYSQPDWIYGEGEFVELGYNGTTKGIINKVLVMGAVFEHEITTVNESEVEDEEWEPESDVEINVEKTFEINEVPNLWSHIETVYETDDCKIICKYMGNETPEGYLFPHFMNYRFEISGLGTMKNTTWEVSGGATITWESLTSCNVQREREDDLLGWPPIFRDKAFTIGISIKVGPLSGSHASWVTESLPEETVETSYEYTQIKASCQDVASIAKYGERQPKEEYTLNKPLAETEEMCTRIGNNKILDSHRLIHQPDILVNFNPLLTIGQNVSLTDTKIGYSGERRFTWQIQHLFPINNKTGAIKPRTKGSMVYYA